MIRQYIAKQFTKPDGIAGILSTMVMNVINQKQYRSVMKHIVHPSDKVLDIGFGNGYVIKKLLKRGYHKIYGMEISTYMLDIVWFKNQFAIQQKDLQLCIGNIEKMPYEDNSFDVQYSINTLYFWETLSAGLREMHRIGKQDSLCILSFYDKAWLDEISYAKYGFQKYKLQDVLESCEANGFIVEELEELVKSKSYTVVLKKA